MREGEFGSDGKEQIYDGMYEALDDRLGDGSGRESCGLCTVPMFNQF
jgi:hypothetical protein